jgi:translation initiation factor 4A
MFARTKTESVASADENLENSFKSDGTSHLNESELGLELETEPTFDSWEDLDISKELLRGIFAHGFEKPSPVQKRAIISILEGRDATIQAQSGTGKTGTFCIASLAKVDPKERYAQALILSPVRELSLQTLGVCSSLGSMIPGLVLQDLVGGSSVEEDIQRMRQNPPHIVTGTPGRVLDLLNKNILVGSKLKFVVLDEADELLSSGFKDQVYNIFQYFSKEVQVALFSATIPAWLSPITKQFLRDPVQILVKAEQLTLEGITQYYIAIDNDPDKFAALRDLYKFCSLSQCVVYCNSIKRVSDLYKAMCEEGFPVCCIHSDMDKAARYTSLQEFRNGKYRVLLSSNVTSRGIDVQQVSTVINFDFPKCTDNYLHRIGRGGRWGRKGTGINFVTRRDMQKLKEIETFYQTQIIEMPGNVEDLFS